ncbi:hypothetical protein MRX96_058969 [Rhipicephalus microplus]
MPERQHRESPAAPYRIRLTDVMLRCMADMRTSTVSCKRSVANWIPSFLTRSVGKTRALICARDPAVGDDSQQRDTGNESGRRGWGAPEWGDNGKTTAVFRRVRHAA